MSDHVNHGPTFREEERYIRTGREKGKLILGKHLINYARRKHVHICFKNGRQVDEVLLEQMENSFVSLSQINTSWL